MEEHSILEQHRLLRQVGTMKITSLPPSHGLAWDYEQPDGRPGFYHIYAYDGPFDETLDDISIEAPITPENDADVQAIADALRRIAARFTEAEITS